MGEKEFKNLGNSVKDIMKKMIISVILIVKIIIYVLLIITDYDFLFFSHSNYSYINLT